MYRRKKEKTHKVEDDSLDLNHGYAGRNVPAGGSYMAKLVPGLKLQDAKPLQRDYRLEREQHDYASTRRGTRYYNGNTPDVGGKGEAGFELPSYGKGGRVSSFYRRDGLPVDQTSPKNGPCQVYNSSTPQQQGGAAARDPFASQPELLYQQDQHTADGVYGQNNGWDHSQSSFLTKKSSHQ